MTSSNNSGGSSVARTSIGRDVLALAPPKIRGIATRRHLQRTNLGSRVPAFREDVPAQEVEARVSLVTRRHAHLRRRRRKRILIAIAIAVAFFPPIWAVYILAWLVWRSRGPQRSMRLVRKGIRALARNQSGVALKRLQEAHLLDPSNNDALYWLGLLLSRQNRAEEAEEALSIVSERVPGLREVEAALVDANIALERPDSAVYHAQRLMDAAPYATSSLMKLADAFEAAGRIDLAIQALEQAPLHKPRLTDELVRIHYRLGTLYEASGMHDRALHHFTRVYAHDATYLDVSRRVNPEDVRADQTLPPRGSEEGETPASFETQSAPAEREEAAR